MADPMRTLAIARRVGAALGGRDPKIDSGHGASARALGVMNALSSPFMMKAAEIYADSGLINPLTGRPCGEECEETREEDDDSE